MIALPMYASAQTVDPNASVVHLRTSCALPGGAALDNCFTSTSAVTDWLWNGGRNSEPSSLDQVAVHVGPGDFEPLDCAGAMRGWTSFIGSGRESTRFVRTGPQSIDPVLGTCPGAITTQDCTGLSFQRLGAQGTPFGVAWKGDGSSRWENVDITADGGACGYVLVGAGWYDFGGSGESVNYFWNMRFLGRGGGHALFAFESLSSENWIYGSDFFLDLQSAQFGAATLYVANTGDVRAFGSTVRAALAQNSNHPNLVGILTNGNAAVHLHGSIVNVSAPDNQYGASVTAVNAISGFVHTPGTAFVLRPAPGGTSTRLSSGGGNIDSPFLWPPGTDPPQNFSSRTGADLFVKTNAGPGADEARLYIYDDGCTSKWRSAMDATCL
jgi:hypothetical protein